MEFDPQAFDRAKFIEAIPHWREQLRKNPGNVEAMEILGIGFYCLGNHEVASAMLGLAFAAGSRNVTAMDLLGIIRFDEKRYVEALYLFDQAVTLVPDSIGALARKAQCLHELGYAAEARNLSRAMLWRKVGYTPEVESNLIFFHDYDPAVGEETRQEARKLWAWRLSKTGYRPYKQYSHSRDPERRLRIGYVSADLRNHSAARVFGPILLNHDPEQVDLYLFSATERLDDISDSFRARAVEWIDIRQMDDDQAAAEVHRREIDILVDLSGHSAFNRLGIFARKPAPIQATGWGYLSGTGLTEVDYLLADPVAAIPSERKYFAEKVADLPCLVAYLPWDFAPEPAELPMLRHGAPCFGVFNRITKLWPSLPLISEVLKAVPGSQLLVKSIGLEDPLLRSRLWDCFADRGIEPHRVSLLGGSMPDEHLAAMARVDIMLDTMPHSGGLSTLEAIWQGVPVMTLSTTHLSGRVSASILDTLGLNDWVAYSPTSFVSAAHGYARQPELLAQLRQGLRQRLAQSIICDGRGYAAAVESLYREVWRKWCARTETASPSAAIPNAAMR